jgi:hypothetical protein
MSIDPIEPELGALFVRARSDAGPPAGAKARVAERLAMIAPPASGVVRAPKPSPRWLQLLGTFALGGAVGAGAMALREPTVVERVVKVEVPSSPAPTSAPSAVVVPAVVIPPAPSAVVAAPVVNVDTLARERTMLDEAKQALGKGDASGALETTRRHEREFPRGQLSEEREAIAVQALVRLGRSEDATARGQRFRSRYPNSVLIPAIDLALEKSKARE